MRLSSLSRSTPLLGVATGLVLLAACGGGGGGSTPITPPTAQVQLDLTPSTDAAHPNWVACQDGDGPWVPLVGSSGHYSFSVTNAAGRYGLAFVISGSGWSGGQLLLATTADTTAIDLRDEVVLPTFTVSGSLDYGLADNLYGIFMENDSYGGAGGKGPILYFPKVHRGLRDMVVLRQRSGQQPEGVAIQRGIDVQGDMTQNPPGPGAEFPLVPATLTVANLPTGQAAQVYAYYRTQNKTLFQTGSTYGTSATPWINTMPAAQQVTGEYHILWAELADGRTIYQAVKNPTTLTLPPSGPMAAPVTTIPVSSPYARPRSAWSTPAGTQATRLVYSGATTSWQVDLSTAWLAGASSYTFPDFHALAGWVNGWGLEPDWITDGTTLTAFQTNAASPFLLLESRFMWDTLSVIQEGTTALMTTARDTTGSDRVGAVRLRPASELRQRSSAPARQRVRPGRLSMD